jgi:hypothetical protein
MYILNVITDNVITLSFCVQFVINLTKTPKKPLLLILSFIYCNNICLAQSDHIKWCLLLSKLHTTNIVLVDVLVS